VLGVLEAERVERIAVANLQRGAAARAMGWHRPILCLGAPVVLSTCEQADAFACEDCCQAAVAADIDATISSVAEARLLAAAAGRQHRRARVQIKIDTGMGRMGIRWEDALPVLAEICACAGVSVEGVYTHGHREQ